MHGRTERRATVPALCGLGSIVLLATAIRWAHHRGATTDALVGGWATVTLATFVLWIRSLVAGGIGRRSARVGLILGSLSVIALVLAGIAYAAGMDPAGACGGG